MNKLPESKVLQFAVFGAALALVTTVPVNTAIFFFVNDLAVSMAVGAMMLSVLGVLEVLFKLSSGIIIQKANMKWGKYRSWIVILRWSIAIGSIVLFLNTQSMPLWVSITVFSVGYLALYASLAFAQTAHYMLITKMAMNNINDRFRLAVRNTQLAIFVPIIISFVTLPLAQILPYTNPYYQPMAQMNILYAVLFLLGAFVLIKASKSYDVPYSDEQIAELPKSSFIDILKAVFMNRSLISILIANTFLSIALGAVGSLTAYYFIALKGRTDMLGFSLLFAAIGGYIAVLFLPRIGIKIGKKKAMVLGLSVYGFSTLGIFFFANCSVIAFIALSTLNAVALYLFRAFNILYLLDCGEYDFWKTGKDNRAVIVSLNSFPSKIGIGIGASLIALIPRSISNYTEMVASTSATWSFMFLFAGIPAICAFIGALIMHFGYQITDKDAEKYIQENAERTEALLYKAE